MGAEKMEAIRALDEALDEEIVHYAKKFAKNPSHTLLDVLAKLVTVDMYTDEYMKEHEDKQEKSGIATK